MEDKCKICGGSKVVEEGERCIECICVLKEKAREYLTPLYVGAQKITKFNINTVLNKNIILTAPTSEVFKGVVKYFLLSTGMKYSHETVTAYDILMAYFQDRESRYFKELSEKDLIFLHLVADPANKSYGIILESLIEKRMMNKKFSWIYTPFKISSGQFKLRYSDAFSSYIDREFKNLVEG